MWPQSSIKTEIHKDSNEYLGKTIIERIEKPLNCWICQSWREVDFFFKFKERILEPTKEKIQETVYVHLDFEKFKPHPMNKMQNQKKYELRRFCPPKVLYFFFTVNGNVVLSPEHDVVITKTPSLKVN